MEKVVKRVPEKILWRGNPSHWSYFNWYFWGAVLTLCFLLGIFLIVYKILECKNIQYAITNKRVRVKHGIVGRKITEIRIRDIRSVVMQQSVIERIFKLGSIAISTSGTAGYEVVLKGISQPEKIRRGLNKLSPS